MSTETNASSIDALLGAALDHPADLLSESARYEHDKIVQEHPVHVPPSLRSELAKSAFGALYPRVHALHGQSE